MSIFNCVIKPFSKLTLVIGLFILTSCLHPKELFKWEEVAFDGKKSRNEIEMSIHVPPKYLSKSTVLNIEIGLMNGESKVDSSEVLIIGEKVEIDKENMYRIKHKSGGQILISLNPDSNNIENITELFIECKDIIIETLKSLGILTIKKLH